MTSRYNRFQYVWRQCAIWLSKSEKVKGYPLLAPSVGPLARRAICTEEPRRWPGRLLGGGGEGNR